MTLRSCVVAGLAAAVLTACASGPRLEYNDFLPNTNENPAWARDPGQPSTPPSAGSSGTSAPQR